METSTLVDEKEKSSHTPSVHGVTASSVALLVGDVAASLPSGLGNTFITTVHIQHTVSLLATSEAIVHATIGGWNIKLPHDNHERDRTQAGQ